jgi:hypothetical protein
MMTCCPIRWVRLMKAHEKRTKDTDNFLVTVGDELVKHPNELNEVQ